MKYEKILFLARSSMGMNTPDIGIRKVTFQGDTVSIHSADWTSANIRGAIRTAQEKKKVQFI